LIKSVTTTINDCLVVARNRKPIRLEHSASKSTHFRESVTMSNAVIYGRYRVATPNFRFAPIPPSNNRTSPVVRSRVSSKVVHCFVDYSNLLINAFQVAKKESDRILPGCNLKIDFPNLKALMQRNRQWGSGFAAAGLERGDEIQAACRREKIEFRVFEPGKHSNKEQGVDEIIQGRMYKLATETPHDKIVVLVTGDGNGCERGEGFLEALKALHNKGFAVEVASWEHCLHSRLRTWTEENGSVLTLDRYFKGLTSEDGRKACSLKEFNKWMLGIV
jgi:hypothetical protein